MKLCEQLSDNIGIAHFVQNMLHYARQDEIDLYRDFCDDVKMQ